MEETNEGRKPMTETRLRGQSRGAKVIAAGYGKHPVLCLSCARHLSLWSRLPHLPHLALQTFGPVFRLDLSREKWVGVMGSVMGMRLRVPVAIVGAEPVELPFTFTALGLWAPGFGLRTFRLGLWKWNVAPEQRWDTHKDAPKPGPSAQVPPAACLSQTENTHSQRVYNIITANNLNAHQLKE